MGPNALRCGDGSLHMVGPVLFEWGQCRRMWLSAVGACQCGVRRYADAMSQWRTQYGLVDTIVERSMMLTQGHHTGAVAHGQ